MSYFEWNIIHISKFQPGTECIRVLQGCNGQYFLRALCPDCPEYWPTSILLKSLPHTYELQGLKINKIETTSPFIF